MKTIHSIARNLLAAPVFEVTGDREVYKPIVEVIITVTEPKVVFDESGNQISRSQLETYRFMSGPNALRKIAKDLEDWAKETEDMFDGFLSDVLVSDITEKTKPEAK